MATLLPGPLHPVSRPLTQSWRRSGLKEVLVASTQKAPRVSPGVVCSQLLTCRQCHKPFDPSINHEGDCRYHKAHYGGEVKRKWKSYFYHKVGREFLYHSEETSSEWGEVENFWDCCGRPDPTDPGCMSSPHKSYDDA